jgi:HEAT repeat protein
LFAIAAWIGQHYWGNPTGRLIRAVREAPDAKARTEAIRCLARNRHRVDSEAAVQTLIWAMRDRSPEVRISAATASMAFTPASAKAIPRLIELLEDEHNNTRIISAWALGRIEQETGQDPDRVTAALVKALDENRGTLFTASWALVRNGRGGLTIPALVRMVKSEDDLVSRRACARLGGIGPLAIPALIEAMRDDRPRTRASAAAELMKIGRVEEAIPILRSLLAVEDQEAVRIATEALQQVKSLTAIEKGAVP